MIEPRAAARRPIDAAVGAPAGFAPTLIVPGFVALAIAFPLAVGSDAAGFFTDGVAYLAMADVFSPWRDADALSRSLYATSRFPPGYPALLALVGAGSSHASIALIFNAAMFAAGAVLLGVLVQGRTGDRRLAFAVALAAALSPLLVRTTLEVMSEPTFVVAMLASLVALDRRMAAAPGGADAWPGVLAGIALLIRDAGLPLLGAIGLIGLLRRRASLLAGAAAAAIPYLLWRASRARYDESVSYGSDLSIAMQALQAEPLAFITTNLQSLGTGAVAGNSFASHSLALAATVLVLVIGLAVAAFRLRRLDPAALATFGMLALFAIWPHPGHGARFAAPFWPLCLLFVAHAARHLGDRFDRRFVTVVAMAALWIGPVREWVSAAPRLGWNLPAPQSAHDGTIDRFVATSRASFERSTDSATRLALAASALREHVRANERTCAAHGEYLAARSRLPIARLHAGSTAEVRQAIAHCDLLFVTGYAIPMRGITPHFPTEHLEPGTWQPRFVSRAPGGAVVAALLERVP